MTMENASRFQNQLTCLMNAVVRAAVVEIVRLVENNSVTLRQELSKSNLENEALKVENESNKKKLQILESKLSISIAAQPLSDGLRHATEAGGRKDDFDHTKERGKPSAEITGAGPQSQERAVQSQQTMKKEVGEGLRVVAMEKDGMKVIGIKKELRDAPEQEIPSPMKDEQLCPKVDMVYGKEWSQSLWRDGREKAGDSDDGTEKEEAPGTSMTQHQNGSLLHCSKLNPSTPILKVFCDPEQDTYPDYRLKRESLNCLFSLSLTGKNRQTVTFKILVFIYWLAHGTSFKTVSETFGIPLSTAASIVRDVADKLIKLSSKMVNKQSPEELALTVAGFGKLARHPMFGKAVGAIGGCHVRVKVPDAPERPLPTINFQGVCDHTGRFIDVFAGLPGSMTDMGVLRHSPLYKMALYPPPGHFVLGNGEYHCLQTPMCLITPYPKSDRHPMHVEFNRHHALAFSAIERAFGIMKKRWTAVFLQPLELHPSFVPKVLAVCTLLHNICLSVGDVLEPVKMDKSKVTEVQKERLAPNETSGEGLRDSLAKQMSTMTCLATVGIVESTASAANAMTVQREHAYNMVVMER
ncbi:putative nuclease HARBI1 isoform X1 [Esox lucius]|uniref:DDE Tnp4 domain-containing protein n=1 Tax=Esox lucius TaxID=8010 RepID=A0AAY5JYN5_ESOLU|nr:putative nuclease HARBI1 isoform X1 [Esox lucius]